MHMDVKLFQILIPPTLVLLITVHLCTRFTYCLCTRLLMDVLQMLLMLGSISSVVENPTDLLYLWSLATALSTGFLIYHLTLPSVKLSWLVKNTVNMYDSLCSDMTDEFKTFGGQIINTRIRTFCYDLAFVDCYKYKHKLWKYVHKKKSPRTPPKFYHIRIENP
jgi:hypothetical protein